MTKCRGQITDREIRHFMDRLKERDEIADANLRELIVDPATFEGVQRSHFNSARRFYMDRCATRHRLECFAKFARQRIGNLDGLCRTS